VGCVRRYLIDCSRLLFSKSFSYRQKSRKYKSGQAIHPPNNFLDTFCKVLDEAAFFVVLEEIFPIISKNAFRFSLLHCGATSNFICLAFFVLF